MNVVTKISILRPGALGDVLVTRGVIRMLKALFPQASITFCAPGERGSFLCRPGWADSHLDWDDSSVAWLFQPNSEKPARLVHAIGDSDLILSFTEPENLTPHKPPTSIEKGLTRVAERAIRLYFPAKPDSEIKQRVGEWLIRSALDGIFRHCAGLSASDERVNSWAAARMVVAGMAGDNNGGRPGNGMAGSYAVLHPGSGSRTKNWPVGNFIEVGRHLAERHAMRVAVTAGEADGEVGEAVADSVPGAVLFRDRPLEQLARLLAGARLYVGNDSGVTHLAGAVARPDGKGPAVVAIFGPSDPAQWAPPEAEVLQAGIDMAGCDPGRVTAVLDSILASDSVGETS